MRTVRTYRHTRQGQDTLGHFNFIFVIFFLSQKASNSTLPSGIQIINVCSYKLWSCSEHVFLFTVYCQISPIYNTRVVCRNLEKNILHTTLNPSMDYHLFMNIFLYFDVTFMYIYALTLYESIRLPQTRTIRNIRLQQFMYRVTKSGTLPNVS